MMVWAKVKAAAAFLAAVAVVGTGGAVAYSRTTNTTKATAGGTASAQPASTQQSSDIDRVTQVLKCFQLAAVDPKSGRGTAHVVEDRNGKHQEWHVSFEFDGVKSRAVIKNGDTETRWFDNGDRDAIFYELRHLMLGTPKTSGYYRELGYDFNPRTFPSSGRGLPVNMSGVIANAREGKSSLFLSKTADGSIRIAGRYLAYPDKAMASWTAIEADPAAGLRLVLIESGQKNDPYKGFLVDKIRHIKWKQYGGSAWYPASASQDGESSTHDYGSVRQRVVVVIDTFEPNVTLPAADFTIESLQVPDGTRVFYADGKPEGIYEWRNGKVVPIGNQKGG